MALPRITAQTSQAPGAVANFTFANSAFTAVGAGSTAVSSFNLPRSFKIQKAYQILFSPGTFQTGITVGRAYITGNAPSCTACTPSNYVLNIPFNNSTGGTLTPTAQTFRVVQD